MQTTPETSQTTFANEALPGVAEARSLVDGVPVQPTTETVQASNELQAPIEPEPSTEQLRTTYDWLVDTVNSLHAASAENRQRDPRHRERGYPASLVAEKEQELAEAAEKLSERRAKELGQTANRDAQL
jgi:hypothetical protein